MISENIEKGVLIDKLIAGSHNVAVKKDSKSYPQIWKLNQIAIINILSA